MYIRFFPIKELKASNGLVYSAIEATSVFRYLSSSQLIKETKATGIIAYNQMKIYQISNFSTPRYSYIAAL